MVKPIGNQKMNLTPRDKVSQRMMAKFGSKAIKGLPAAETPEPAPPPHIKKRPKFKTRSTRK